MNEKSDSKWLSFATVSILGQPSSKNFFRDGVKTKRLKAAWSHDSLLKIIGVI